jgi:hypothetical protein
LGAGLLRGGAPTGGSSRSAEPTVTNQQSIERVVLRDLSSTPNPCPEKDLIDALDLFLPPPPKGSDTSACKGEALHDKFKQLADSSNDISFAIATVPDPIHTHLSLFFDRTMDAIQQGAQEAGWTFDRATLPWDSHDHPESSDFRLRLQQDDYQGDKEDLPGLMVFRPSSPDVLNQSLFVLVVGETPTGGISKKQLNLAVEWIQTYVEQKNTISRNSKPPQPEINLPLRIIGPTFSGSLYSLAQWIAKVPAGQFPGLVIRSGTVSSWDTQQWFNQHCFPDGLPVDFATFQQSDRYMLRKFIAFEKNRGYAPEKIAVLTEDETAYGNVKSNSNSGKPESSPSSASASCPTGTRALSPNQPTDDDADEDSVLHLYFPRDISQLRSAYQQGFEQHASSSDDSYKIRAALPLNLQDSGSDDDTVPQYAHSQSPLSQESILLGLVASIRRHQIQFVVLKATNPMDTVFLSAFFKKGYSEARVVAEPADLLLSRDVDDTSLLHGVMALTTYSLLPRLTDEVASHAATASGNPLVAHIFPAAYSAGAYNATLSQIACIPSPSSGTPPSGCAVENGHTLLPIAGYAEYERPFFAQPPCKDEPPSPVVWLTVLGRDGFWPISILDDCSPAAGNIPSSPRPMNIPAPPTRRSFPTWPLFWRIVAGFTLFLVATYGFLLWKSSIFASSSAMTLFAPIADPYGAVLIVLVGWLFLIAMLLLAWPCVAWLTWSFETISLVVSAAIAVSLHCWSCFTQLNRRKATRASLMFMYGAALLVLFSAVLFLLPAHSRNAFLLRYIHLTSGVSPLLPLLCLLAAGLWWGWFSLSGLALVDQRRPKLPAEGDPTDPNENSVQQLIAVAKPCAWDARVFAPLLLPLAILLCAMDYRHPVLSFDTGHFEWLYAICLALVTLALFASILRLLVVWLECRKILIAIDRLPLRRAFAELNFTWEPFWRMGGGEAVWSSRLVSRQLETLEHLIRQSPKPEPGVSDGATCPVDAIGNTLASRDKFRQDFALFPKSDSLALSEFCLDRYQRLEASIAGCCAAVLKLLKTKWQGTEGVILHEIGSDDDDKKVTVVCREDKDETDPSLLTCLAERFVALVYLNFILSITLRMRTLGIAIVGLYVFLLLSVESYPFEPRTALRSASIFILIFIVGMVGYVSAQVHRDPILSLVMQTKPGELGVEFWVRMGTFIALPLISLLVSQFPALNNALFSWLEPAVNALK